ncbi:4-hydroxybenzoate polyprenyltransferase [Saccharothrix saharensis]|uniref:4-hydroxybenzoate polyprenyltransferase n=1 Tax=Saccharothrix saharensis TaxID=571190 RepID=A0A543J904_9PSEU|nr:UbiA family prenyltransferase [Saccharothrix saharensis]TQM79296.1 4-hydroxybenzoate polyprenyltransferase [Saccharothrix saharensis]
MRAYAELVRAPAALTVLGDTLVGAAAAGAPLRGKRLLLPLASVALYWSGMALNDWADRELDAVERPERPIPSGRVRPRAALTAAAALSATGLGLAAAAGGRDALAVAAPLAVAVWSYDTVLKDTPAGPLAMAACRALDVLMGAGRDRVRTALPAAAAMAAHTAGVTVLSRGEVRGASPGTAKAVLGGTAATAVSAITRPVPTWRHRLGALAGAAAYAGTVGRAQLAAVRDPGAGAVRSATRAGIHGMVPLQSALLARSGALPAAAAVALVLPLARALSRKVGPT